MLPQGDDFTDDDQGRGPKIARFDLVGDRQQGAGHGALARPGAPLDGGRRRVSGATAIAQSGGDVPEPATAHEDDERGIEGRQLRPVHAGRVLGGVFMPGHEDGNSGDVAVGQWDPGVGEHAVGRGYSRNDLEGDAGLAHGLGFLAAAAEHVGIAALETDDALAGAGMRDQQLEDLVEGAPAVTSPVADADALGVRTGEVEQPPVEQVVVEDDVGFPQVLSAAQGEQSGITRTGADEVHTARARRREGARVHDAGSRLRAPDCTNCSARRTPHSRASSGEPVTESWSSTAPSGEPTRPSR